jgi:thiol-disulfide isomerase/thioredoxin
MMRSWMFLVLVALLAQPLAAAELKTLPAQPAPLLVLPSLSGPSVDLGALRGKVVLVNFWAVWCPPCRKEMPSMNRLMSKLEGRPFTILGVNEGESPEEINAFLRQVPVNFPILLDRQGELLKSWRVFAFPTSYVVDKRGNLRLGLFGSIEWDSPEAVAQLEQLLAEPD